MPNLNKVMMMGNLTRDPELRYTPNNTAVAHIGIAMNYKWKDANGQQKEETTFVDCEAWGKQAETLAQYTKKGDPIYLEGRMKLDQWEDKEGNNRSKIKVVVTGFQFLSYGDSSTKQSPHQGQARQQRPQRAPQPVYHEPISDEDIPF